MLANTDLGNRFAFSLCIGNTVDKDNKFKLEESVGKKRLREGCVPWPKIGHGEQVVVHSGDQVPLKKIVVTRTYFGAGGQDKAERLFYWCMAEPNGKVVGPLLSTGKEFLRQCDVAAMLEKLRESPTDVLFLSKDGRIFSVA